MNTTDSRNRDVERIAEQERRLRLPRFDLAIAWELGCRLRERALARRVAVAIEVRLAKETVFFCTMPGATPANADWARRKRNTVELMHRSSYVLGHSVQDDAPTVLDRMALAPRDYAIAGGAFPLNVEGVGCVGVATVSGLPQREDHELIVEVLAEMCRVPHDELRLDA